MAYTTKAFVQALGNLSITGVTTAYDEPPRQLNTAQLPASFPRLPEEDSISIAAFSSALGLREITAELVIVFNPYQQGMQASNFSGSLDIIDALHTALETAAPTMGLNLWGSRGNVEFLGDTAYWVLVTRVTGSGS